MPRLILFNKPYGVICQFSGGPGHRTLAEYIPVPGVYAAGRLDTDSEGLLLLTDDGGLQHRVADPRHKLPKTYLVQVEGEPDEPALARLRQGVDLGDFVTLPCEARRVAEPDWLWPRDPPVRFRKSVPTSWLEIVLREGKNRQVRRMTAKVGHPTLRLIRVAIGAWSLAGLQPGRWRETRVEPPRSMGPDAASFPRPPARPSRPTRPAADGPRASNVPRAPAGMSRGSGGRGGKRG